MAARTIVTLHPDVECDVCGRRLLRGERPDVFLGGGQRHMVCELCTPRAAHEGWHRGIEGHTRGRSLLGRLRQLREPARSVAGSPGTTAEPPVEGARGIVRNGSRRTRASARAAEWAKLEPEWTALDEEWVDDGTQPTVTDDPPLAKGAPLGAPDSEQTPAADTPDALELSATAPEAVEADRDVLRALEIFNGGATPRRIASVTRALGEACVHVTRDTARESVVAIVVAWELCWYRYELDLEDATGEVRIAAEGTELEELPADQRVANALADEHGSLSLAAA